MEKILIGILLIPFVIVLGVIVTFCRLIDKKFRRM